MRGEKHIDAEEVAVSKRDKDAKDGRNGSHKVRGEQRGGRPLIGRGTPGQYPMQRFTLGPPPTSTTNF